MAFDLLARAAFGVGIEASVRTALLVVLAAVALRMARPRRAATSLAVWSAVLGLACALPVIESVAPLRWTVPIVTSVQLEAPADADRPAGLDRASGAPSQRHTVAPIRTGTASVVVAPPTAPPPPQRSAAPAAATRPLDWIVLAAGVYLAVVLIGVGQLYVGWRVTRALARGVRPIEDVDAVRASIARVMPGRRLPRCVIGEADEVVVPITTGHVRPIVMLPASWTEWTSDTLDAVLAHELSHVARGDAWRQLAALIYRAVFWPSPVAWLLHRRVIDDAERASDEAALDAGGDRTQYAELLIAFFGRAAAARGRADWSLAMARGRGSERRIARVLAWEPREVRHAWWLTAVGVVLAAPAAALVSAATPINVVTSLRAPGFHWPRASDPVTPRLPPDASREASARNLRPALAPPAAAASPAQGAIPQLSVVGRASTLADRVVSLSDFNGSRRVLFVFDLAHLSDDGLRNAASRASFYAEGMATRAAVGLDSVHLWSVSDLEAPTRPAVFSRDSADVARLAAGLRLPPPTPAAVTARTVQTVCAALARQRANARDLYEDLTVLRQIGSKAADPQDTRMVVLFSDAPDGLASGSDTLATAAHGCEQAGVALLTVTSQGVLWPDDLSASPAPTLQSTPASAIARTAPLTRDVALVFDLREVSGVDLGIDLELAHLLVQTFAERARVGVDIPHQFEIATIGGTVDVQLPFTSDVAQVSNVLAGMANLPASNVTGSTATKALTDYCSSLTRGLRSIDGVPSGAVPSVVYFGAPRRMSGTLSTCADQHVDVFLGPMPLMQATPFRFVARSGSVPQLSATVAERSGAPVSLTLRDTHMQGGYVTALIRNTSTKTVRSVTLQAVLRAEDGAPASRVFSRAGPATIVAPGVTAEIASQVVDPDALRGVSDRLHVEIAVVEVDFTDGSVWRSGQEPSAE